MCNEQKNRKKNISYGKIRFGDFSNMHCKKYTNIYVKKP